ncbi:MAG: class I SAM-dependent methyltransferase [Desulfovermiculus sp.]|nr:class I SAM-dependent methyltransferase [Desulfovermiculus sp.]
MYSPEFMMENEQEALRLDLKTDPQAVKQQALWAGLKPDMNVADLGCGAGITTHCLRQVLSAEANIYGVDFSQQRIDYAKKHYSGNGITYLLKDIRDPSLQDLGGFDFIWIRFVLEYYYSQAFSILENVIKTLNPGGILCLIDLDHNCLCHYGLPARLMNTISGIIEHLHRTRDFDPYAGRRLYSFLYDLGMHQIDVNVSAHNVYYGQIPENQVFNSLKKLEVAGKNSGYGFEEYGGDYQLFLHEFTSIFFNSRRFSYTPLVSCRGFLPLE